MSNPKRTMAATMLLLEAFSVFFGALAAGRLPGSPGLGRMLALMGGLALALVLTAGILRRPGGYLIGSLLQVVVLATGWWLPMMYVVGAVFAALWFTALRVGSRIERERAAAGPPG